MFKSTRKVVSYNGFWILILFFNLNSVAQSGLSENKLDDSKIWETKQVDIIRSLYLNSNGMNDHNNFLRTHGLYPTQLTTKITPYFSISFLQSDVKELSGKLKFLKATKPIHVDFFVESLRSFYSLNVSKPIWDGRVYEEKNKIIVGGYSSKHNEKPVAKLSNEGKFLPFEDNNIANEFPILQIPTEQIVFDPFEWKLLKVTPADGKKIEERVLDFLPIRLFDHQGRTIDNLRFVLESAENNSAAVLYGLWQNNKIEIAKCSFLTSKIIDKKQGYQPTLIEGAVQPADGKVITFTFEGEFFDGINQNEDALQIASSILKRKLGLSKEHSLKNEMKIDGLFHDWRNIEGVSDPKGDFVSHLYPNTDTDLLEAKVTNDDQYLYLYSRVVGAHGKTGSKGR